MSPESSPDQGNLSNNPEATTEAEVVQVNSKEGNKSTYKKAAYVAGALALIITASTLLAACDSNKNSPPKVTSNSTPSEETTDATAYKSEANVSTDGTNVTVADTVIAEYDYSKPLENAVECYGFEKLTAEQQAEIKKMEAMTIEEFQALPEADQLKFSYWVFENYKGRFDYILQTADVKINLEYTETPTTPQEYSDNYAYVQTMASSIFTNKIRADGTSSTGNVTDILTGQKIMVLRDTATDVHNKANNAYVNRFNGLVILAEMGYSVTGYKAIENGMVLNMHQDATDTIPVDLGAADGQRTMTEVTFEDIYGKEITISVCSLAIQISDSRVIPVTAVS